MAQAMQNNPFFRIAQAARSGQNPMPLMQEFAKQTPMFNQPLQMINGKDVAAQRQTAINMAKEYGVDLNQFAAQFGISLPNN